MTTCNPVSNSERLWLDLQALFKLELINVCVLIDKVLSVQPPCYPDAMPHRLLAAARVVLYLYLLGNINLLTLSNKTTHF